MNRYSWAVFALTSSLCFISVHATETKLSGFGSVVGTVLLDDEGYWVKHPSGAGFYSDGNNLEINEESLVGFQGVIKPDDKISIVGQAILRGQFDYEPQLEQFFVGYDLGHSWNAKFGKLRNPIYLFSDVMDIHYSFGWLRTPGSSYSLSAIGIDGVSLMYTGDIGPISNRTIFYYGRSKKDPDPFLSELFVNRGFQRIDEETGESYALVAHKNDIQDAFGISTEFFHGPFTFHLAFMEAGGEKDSKTYADGSIIDEVYDNRDFYDIAINYDDGTWLGIAEWNQYVDVYTSSYVTIGRYFNQWQFLLTSGSFDGEVVLANGFRLPDVAQEQTSTLTFSSRYDLTSSVALKMELTKFSNEGSLIVPDKDGDGEIDSTTLSFAIDFIF